MVEPNQLIEEFDPIVEVMSDKATVEITSPFSGRIINLAGAIGDMIKVGGRLCDVDTVAEDSDTSAGVGAGDNGRMLLERVEVAPQVSQVPAVAADAYPVEVISVTAPASTRVIHATPATRRLAKESAISLNDIIGTGRDGRVTKGDVMAFVNRESPNSVASPVPSTPPAPIPVPASSAPVFPTPLLDTIIPLTPVRKAMHRAMTATLAIPHFSYSETIDVTALLALRAQLNKTVPLHLRKTLTRDETSDLERGVAMWGKSDRVEEDGRVGKVSLLPLLVKALSKAMSDHPLFACTLATPADGQPHFVKRSAHDISLAVSSPTGGLFTPLLPSVQHSSPFDLASQIATLQAATVASTLTTPPKFPSWSKRSGTITLSNIGVIGGKSTSPIIPPTGQLAIGALGRIRVVPVYSKSVVGFAKEVAMRLQEGEIVGEDELEELKIVPRMMMDVTFAADHRVVEGIELARLVESWKGYIEEANIY